MQNALLNRIARVLAAAGFGIALGLAVPIAFLAASSQLYAAATPEDVFKEKRLTRVGFLLITSDEAAVHADVASLRAMKAKVAAESLARANMARSIQTAIDAINKIDHDLAAMKEELNGLQQRPAEYNQVVDSYNSTLNVEKQRRAALDELEKKQAKIQNSQSLYNESVIASMEKADTALTAYAALAGDSVLGAAIVQYNKTAPQAVKLGPSGACAADIAFLKKWIGDMEADGVPVRIEGGVPVVEVIINGKKREMLWDSGAASIFLSAASANEMGIHLTDQDPVIKTTAADGRTIECRLVVIPQVRVGPFTAHNVEAVVAPPGDTRGADLLGGSFQNHFQCRLDQEASVLHLIPNPVTAVAPRPASGAAVAPAAGDIFQTKGLVKAGDMFVAAQEADIHATVLSLRALRSRVTSEAAARTSMSEAVQKAGDMTAQLDTQLTDLETEMKKQKDNAGEYHRLFDIYNATFKQYSQRRATLLELRKKLGRMEDSQSLYTQTALASAQKAGAVLAVYARATNDAPLKAAIDKLNKGSTKPLTLGPSAAFKSDLATLQQMLEDIANEGVPIRIEGGVPNVVATINGKNVEMVWDSGASFVSFSAETAAALGLHATDQDPTVTSVVADGKEVQSKVIVVPSITVGGYTAVNVKCEIDPPGAQRSPDLLGGSFQEQFLCKLDVKAGVLHLTPNDKSAAAQAAAASTPPSDGAPSASPASTPAAASGAAAHVIVVSAEFGTADHHISVARAIQDRINADPLAPIEVANWWAADPASGAHKTLNLSYRIGTSRYDIEVPEDQAFILPPIPSDGIAVAGASVPFKIIAARYGVDNHWLDVTSAVRADFVDPSQGRKPRNYAGKDLHPGRHKFLAVYFEIQGRRYCRIGSDDGELRLITQ